LPKPLFRENFPEIYPFSREKKKLREIRGFLAEGHANWQLVRNFLQNLV
jgi:hypothetical protein